MSEENKPIEGAEEETLDGFEMELPDLHQELLSACNAYNTVSEIDTGFPSEAGEKALEIKDKSLDIILYYVRQLHSDIFGEEE